MYDRTVSGRSPGIRDAGIQLPTEPRRAEQERWLRRYRQGLIAAGVAARALEAAVAEAL